MSANDSELQAQMWTDLLIEAIEADEISDAHTRLHEAASTLPEWTPAIRARVRELLRQRLNEPRTEH
jgi:hypothetical protein